MERVPPRPPHLRDQNLSPGSNSSNSSNSNSSSNNSANGSSSTIGSSNSNNSRYSSSRLGRSNGHRRRSRNNSNISHNHNNHNSNNSSKNSNSKKRKCRRRQGSLRRHAGLTLLTRAASLPVVARVSCHPQKVAYHPGLDKRMVASVRPRLIISEGCRLGIRRSYRHEVPGFRRQLSQNFRKNPSVPEYWVDKFTKNYANMQISINN
jgi:hypothetical protein